MQFEEKIRIQAPADQVFSTYANVAGWPNWDPDVLSASIDGDFKTGTSGKLKPKGSPETKVQLINVTDNESFTVECKLPLCKMHFEHELSAADNGTEVLNRVVFSGLLAPVFGRLIGSGISKSMPASLQGLKQHIESA